MMVYGALIWLISVYQPKGVWGFLSSLGQRRAPAPAAAPAPEARP
jgi:hypothetical protein